MRTTDLAREAATFTAARLLAIGIGFVVTPLVINSLGFELYGVWALLTAVVAYLSVADLGLGPALVRFAAAAFADGDFRTIRRLATVSTLAFAALGIPVTAATWFGAEWAIGIFDISPRFEDVAIKVLVLMSAYIFLAQAADVLNGLVLSTGSTRPAALVQGGSHLAYAVTVVLILANDGGLLALVAANYVRLPVLAGASFFIVRRRLGRVFTVRLRGSRTVLSRVARFGGWIQMNSIARLISVQADAVLVGALIGPIAVGVYDIGRKPAFAARTLPLSTLAPVLPKATEHYQRQDRGALGALLETSTKLLALTTLGLFGLLAAVSSQVLDVWIGTEVPPAAHTVLLMLLASYAVNNMTGTFTTFARALERPSIETRYAWLATALNVGLTLLLAPIYGLEGVVVATVVANIAASIYLLATFGRSTGLRFSDATVRWRVPLLTSVTGAACVTAVTTAALPGEWFDSRLTGLGALGALALFYLILLWTLLRALRFPGLPQFARQFRLPDTTMGTNRENNASAS